MEAYSSQKPPFSESTRPPPSPIQPLWSLVLGVSLVLGAWSLGFCLPPSRPTKVVRTRSGRSEPVRTTNCPAISLTFTYVHLRSLIFSAPDPTLATSSGYLETPRQSGR